MTRAYLRFLANGNADRIVTALTEEQYIKPHQTVATALTALEAKIGFCSGCSTKAMQTLEIDPAQVIGRLRRSELLQLARTVGRIWRQSVAAPAAGVAEGLSPSATL